MANFFRRSGRLPGKRHSDADGAPEPIEWLPEALAKPEISTLAAPVIARTADAGTALPDTEDHRAGVQSRRNLPDALDAELPSGHLARLKIRAGIRHDAISSTFRHLLQQEEVLGTWFNFIPVILGIGIAAYYLAPSEPSLPVLAVSALLPAVIALRLNTHGRLWKGLVALACLFCGMSAAAVHTRANIQPVPVSEFTARMDGVVLEADRSGSGSPRYVIRPLEIEGLPPQYMPERIRLTARASHTPFQPGDRVAGLARLQPFSGPAYPGGYDFSFFAWHDGLAATGYFMGEPVRSSQKAVPLGFFETVFATIGGWRSSISGRIRAALPGETGDIAAALVTGDRSGLSDETEESLRASGLAHILAISGLHMALVTLTVIWLVRLVLVLVPNLAVNHPVSKWATAAGFAVSTGYLLISGAGVATQRAWIMISVMLAASLMDRRALTMRNVAVAAIAILLLDPASLFQPGFQMSFAAVTALVSFYGWINRRKMQREHPGIMEGGSLFARLVRYMGGIAATSLVAGLATGLFAAWHFHRVALFGLFANLAAMPVVSIAVMPLALFSVFLMPYGFEGLALAPLDHAIRAVLAVSAKVNAWGGDHSTGVLPAPLVASGIIALGLLCLLATRLRLLALFPLAVFAGLGALASTGAIGPAKPDVLLAQAGRAIAVRRDDGSYYLAPGSRDRFTTGIWKRAWSPEDFAEAPSTTLPCTRERCDMHVQGQRLSLVYAPAEIENACREADLLFAPRLWWVRCDGRKPGVIVTRTDLEQRGSHAFYLEGSGSSWRIETAWPEPNGGSVRPWLKRYKVPDTLRFSRKPEKNDGKS